MTWMKGSSSDWEDQLVYRLRRPSSAWTMEGTSAV